MPWPTIWTVCLFTSLSIFAVMCILVTIGGAQDIRTLLKDLQNESQENG